MVLEYGCNYMYGDDCLTEEINVPSSILDIILWYYTVMPK